MVKRKLLVMTQKVKVSVIITVAEDRGYLDVAIKSAIDQKFKNYEIILASDGNPEMKNYADKYNLRFLLNKKGNAAKNANKASKIAHGEFIKFLSDDDLLTPNCLMDLTANIKDNALIFANAIDFWANGKTILRKPIMRENFKELLRLKSSYIHGGTIMFRKDVLFNCGGFDERLDSCEEYDFYLNLLSKGYKFTYLDKTVYRYRKHDKNKSRIACSPERMIDKNFIVSKYS